MSPVPSFVPPEPSPVPPTRASLHPPGLYVLALAEAFERFGFYLMLALFTLYLNEHHQFSESRAFDWYGSYLSAVYFAPLIGGWLGGRLLLRRSWVLAGALLLALGYMILSLGTPASLLPALCMLTLGNGLFKPNISTLVGSLYAPGDSRRDEAFGIFYLAVNVGAMIGPISGEILRGRVGWTLAFMSAAASLLLSALSLRLGRHYLPTQSQEPPPETRTSSRARTGDQRRVAALLVVGALVIPFWMAYFQSGSTLTFFARDSVNRVIRIGNWQTEVPPGYFSSLGGLFVLLLTGPLAVVMRALQRRGLHLTSADKIVAGLGCAGLAYALLCLVVRLEPSHGVHLLWLIAFYFVLTIAELLLSPVGLSLVSKLSPVRWVGVLMGVWFLGTSGGNKLAGQVGSLWTNWSHGHFFGAFALLLAVTASVLATQLTWLRKTLPRENS